MVAKVHLQTYADLEAAREVTTDRLELIGGEIFVSPAPVPFHQFVNQRLYDLLKASVVQTGLGLIAYAPFDVMLDEHDVLQPDLFVLLGERRKLIGEKGIEGPPSLVIEIASSSTMTTDLGRKRLLYARHGVPEFWLVDPASKRVTIFSEPIEGHYRLEQTAADVAVSATIPGLSADLSALFAPVNDH